MDEESPPVCAVCCSVQGDGGELELPCPGPGVKGSMVRRISDLMKGCGYTLLRVAVFDDGEHCTTTITCEDKEKD